LEFCRKFSTLCDEQGEKIKAAIEELSLEERAELAALLAGEFPDDDWDRLMKVAAEKGKFDRLNAQAEADLRQGRCVDLDSCGESRCGFPPSRHRNSGNSITNSRDPCGRSPARTTVETHFIRRVAAPLPQTVAASRLTRLVGAFGPRRLKPAATKPPF